MKSWYDLTKEEKRKLKEEYNKKNNDNIILITLNVLKVIFYLISFIAFFFVIAIILFKINGECYSSYCENNLVFFIAAFIVLLTVGLILSAVSSKIKRHFYIWLKSKNIEK